MRVQSRTDYAVRIGAAPQGELVVIAYEILLERMSQALGSPGPYSEHVEGARMALNALMSGLDMSQNISGELLSIYAYVDRLLVRAYFNPDNALINEAYDLCAQLHEAFREAQALSADTQPVVKKSQEVYAGLTYDKGGLKEHIVQNEGRTFKG